jgi:TRAP-type uncharacterized transport system substrate-binding protein
MIRNIFVGGMLLFGIISTHPALADPTQCEEHEMCICTGSPTGNYQKAGEAISALLGDLAKHVRYVPTNGSLDNLNYVAKGICTAGITQTDVFDLWKTESPVANNVVAVQDLYTEYTHILCPASAKIADMSGLADKKATLIIGPPGSGTAETWRSLRQVNEKKYGNTNIDISADPADAVSVQTVKASNGKPHPVCMLWISGLNSTAMQNANARSLDAATGKPTLQLITVDDPAFLKLQANDGGKRYAVTTISPKAPTGTQPGFYNNLINNGGYIFGSAGVDVLGVKAAFILNKDFRDKMNRDTLAKLTTAVDDASGNLRKQMSPGS